MSTCDTCKWWTEHEFFPNGYRQCKNKKLDNDKLPDGAMAEAMDDTGIHFRTGPKFGCVHWQLKHWQPSPEEMAKMQEGAE